MDKSTLVGSALTAIFVLGLVAYRLLWAGSSAASAAGLGRLPILTKSWRRWLLGVRKEN